jgi:hypothetical protein
MKLCYPIVFLVCVLSLQVAYAQTFKVSGQTTDSQGKPLPFVNIGIKNKNKGTVSSFDGRFSITLNWDDKWDTLTFSHVGYENLIFPVDLFITQNIRINTFPLEAVSKELEEVVVYSLKRKVRKIGTKTRNPFISCPIAHRNGNDIIEHAKLISLSNEKSKLLSAHIWLGATGLDTAAFRINFYAVKNRLPAERIVHKHIVAREPVQNGWITIDLSHYQIYLKEDFFISYEFLPSKGSFNDHRMYYGAQFGGVHLSRTSSLGLWERMAGATMSAYLVVEQNK